MTLVELFSVIDSDCDLAVWAINENDPDESILVGLYDGRESIDPKYNDAEVSYINGTASGGIEILLDLDVSPSEAIDVYE